jgi:gamma-glutamylcyclotransferase (GGCT)/AIG2-like uncharacterized protein YtfP
MKFPFNIAVYGTLRAGYGNHSLISNSDFIGSGLTNNLHTLTASGIPFVEKNGGTSRVRVEVYAVSTREELERLDSLEGHPSWYRREDEEITLDSGEVVTAQIYFNSSSKGNTVINSGDYADYAVARRRERDSV